MSKQLPKGCSKKLKPHDIIEWETWKGDFPFWQHVIAGSVAGLAEHCFMFPLDTIKTNLQVSRTLGVKKIHGSIFSLCLDFHLKAGYTRYFRGLQTICIGSVPAHASLFSVYELSKKYIGIDNPVNSAICGSLATMSHDIILTPIDVIKQRLQLGGYGSAYDCVKTIYQKEGMRAFVRSLPTTLCMNIPYGAMFVLINETLKNNLSPNQPFLYPYFLYAGIAGGIAGAITTPLDVIKTRLQTQFTGVRNLLKK